MLPLGPFITPGLYRDPGRCSTNKPLLMRETLFVPEMAHPVTFMRNSAAVRRQWHSLPPLFLLLLLLASSNREGFFPFLSKGLFPCQQDEPPRQAGLLVGFGFETTPCTPSSSRAKPPRQQEVWVPSPPFPTPTPAPVWRVEAAASPSVPSLPRPLWSLQIPFVFRLIGCW